MKEEEFVENEPAVRSRSGGIIVRRVLIMGGEVHLPEGFADIDQFMTPANLFRDRAQDVRQVVSDGLFRYSSQVLLVESLRFRVNRYDAFEMQQVVADLVKYFEIGMNHLLLLLKLSRI